MKKERVKLHRVFTTYLGGLSLIAVFCALIFSGAPQASPAHSLDLRILGELEHLVIANHAGQIRVDKLDTDQGCGPESGNDNLPWLAGDQRGITGISAAQHFSTLNGESGTPSCRSFWFPPLRAPPLA